MGKRLRSRGKRHKSSSSAVGRTKFILGSAFVLSMAGFVMYKSVLSESAVLGPYTSKLLVKGEEGNPRVEQMRQMQQKRNDVSPGSPVGRGESLKTDMGEGEVKNLRIRCDLGEQDVRELSRDECAKLLQQKRMRMVENQNSDAPAMRRGNLPPDDKVRVELEDGKYKTVLREDGTNVARELSPEESRVIKSGMEIEGRSLKEGEDGRKIIENGQYSAKSELPIAVDVATNQLVVTTSTGQKIVTVLPEQAVANLSSRGVISLQSEDSQDFEVTEENGVPVYKIEGTTSRRFLGVLPFESRARYTVSAVDGSVSEEAPGFMGRLFAALSF